MNTRAAVVGILVVLVRRAPVSVIQYNVVLDAGQEVPAPNLGGATSSRTATVDVTTITGNATLSGTFAGLSSNAVASHLHGLAPSGTPTRVLFPLTIDAATSGSFSGFVR